ncbi:CHASE domain-containing protein [Candidatus Bealeia paramacronuclearis]
MKELPPPEQKDNLNFCSSKILKKKAFWIGVIIPFILTLGLYQGFFYVENKDAKDHFGKEAKTFISTFAEKLERYEDVVFAIQSFYAANPSVDSKKWGNFVKSTLSHNEDFPAIDNISYIQKVSSKGAADLICPRIYSYPQNSNSKYLEFDVCSDPQMHELLLRPFDWNRPYVGSNEKNHLTFILPQYDEGSPPQNQKETVARTQGWIILTLNMENFVSTFFPDQKHFLKISLHDQGKVNSIYENALSSSENVFSHSTTLPLSNSQLSIIYSAPSALYEIDSVHFIGYLILGFGTLLSTSYAVCSKRVGI